MERRAREQAWPSRIWFTSFGASQLLWAMTRDHFNGRPPEEAKDPQEVGDESTGGVLPLSQSQCDSGVGTGLPKPKQN